MKKSITVLLLFVLLFSSGDLIEKLQKMYVEIEALREEMRYYKKRLQECSGLIAEMRFAMIDQEKSLFDSEKVRKSARIEVPAPN